MKAFEKPSDYCMFAAKFLSHRILTVCPYLMMLWREVDGLAVPFVTVHAHRVAALCIYCRVCSFHSGQWYWAWDRDWHSFWSSTEEKAHWEMWSYFWRGTHFFYILFVITFAFCLDLTFVWTHFVTSLSDLDFR